MFEGRIDYIFEDVKDDLLNHLNIEATVVSEIELNNGVSLSVQASSTHYCQPKINHGVWQMVELRISSTYRYKIPKSLLNYKEGNWHGGYIILAYVPISLVVSFIIISGGRV